MSLLPFDAFLKNVSSKPYQITKAGYLEEGKYPVVDQGQKFITGYSNNDEKVFKNDESVIIFGDHTRLIKYVDFDFVIGADGTKVLIPVDDSIDTKYAYYHLLSTKIENLGYSRHYKLLKEKTFVKPSMEKQQEIVKALDKAKELIGLRQEALDKLDELAQSVFIDMFGDPILNPNNLVIKKLDDVSQKITDGEHGTVARTETGRMYLMARNISKLGELDLTELSFISEESHNKIFKRCNAEYNDLLLVCVGATIGKCTLVPDMKDFSLARSVALIKPIKTEMNSKYLLYFFKTEFMRRQIEKSSNASAQAGLYTGAIKKMKIMIPSLNLQKKFASIIEKLEVQKSYYKVELDKLQENFDALLAQNFEG
ncbi:restriction endonuclease subunit S [Candidatus Sulfurimonas marisnigri]|uniref:Restriction endonuclease subunit S n=1 Tax=Candidatus Sulfurimonas marisnigri TaxID=2740405 RepID=A0A7S7M1Q8_9BACT|nr:restriction endonuclease subunit S [Candidatus Sulfurimonas marisnigri]QOY55325.1 restriction endonuclease subunit S [Candidatus Sulfurimonas marisnigri]